MLFLSLGVIVSVELSVACNIHIGEKGYVRFRYQHHTCASFFNFPLNSWSNPDVYKPKTFPQNFS